MSEEARVSIGEMKRDLSELVNRVAYGKERLILTSRGRPKAGLVSIEDIEWLRNFRDNETNLEEWLQKNKKIATEIHDRRKGVPLDIDGAIRESRADLENRDVSSH